MTYYLWFTSF